MKEETKKKIQKIVILSDPEYKMYRMAGITSILSFVAMFATVGIVFVGCIIALASKQIVVPIVPLLIASTVSVIINVIAKSIHDRLEKIGELRGQELLK